MHNTFLKDAVSTETKSSKAFSMVKIIFESPLCISIAYNNPYASDGEEILGCEIVTVLSTREGYNTDLHETS